MVTAAMQMIAVRNPHISNGSAHPAGEMRRASSQKR
jgi:hypothetical protein